MQPHWCYSNDRNSETWSGHCATREEAIAEGTDDYESESFFVAMSTPPDPRVIGADCVIDMMAECGAEQWGEAADDWPTVTDEARLELENFLDAWMVKYCTPEFGFIDSDDAEEINPTEDAK